VDEFHYYSLFLDNTGYTRPFVIQVVLGHILIGRRSLVAVRSWLRHIPHREFCFMFTLLNNGSCLSLARSKGKIKSTQLHALTVGRVYQQTLHGLSFESCW
jgi:hypothetical protein